MPGGLPVVEGFVIVSVVVFLFGAQPKLKLVGLVIVNVGNADSDVTVTCLTVVQPFNKFVATTV